jgi:hypothetical protein
MVSIDAQDIFRNYDKLSENLKKFDSVKVTSVGCSPDMKNCKPINNCDFEFHNFIKLINQSSEGNIKLDLGDYGTLEKYDILNNLKKEKHNCDCRQPITSMIAGFGVATLLFIAATSKKF